jgi:hypothetical protein
VYLDENSAENDYQLAAPERLTAEKLFEARWAATLVEATLTRLRGELQSEGKRHVFDKIGRRPSGAGLGWF